MSQHQSPARRLVASFVAIAAVALPLWAGCGVGCTGEGMECCELAPLAAVAAPCCPAAPELTGRTAIATAADQELTPTGSPEPATMAGGVVTHASEASPEPATGPPLAPSVPLFLLHSVSLS